MPTLPVATSDTHPIRVDAVPLRDLPGTLGLTIAPGKQGPRPVAGGTWRRDLDQDLARLRGVYGTEVLVSLMRPFEYRELGIADLDERAAARGIHVRRFPITDMRTPAPADALAFDGMVDGVRGELADGRTVTVHCRGGRGRSGLVAACVLVRSGMAPGAAIGHVRAHLEGAVETEGQEAYVRSYAGRIARTG
jgi:protein-tyrosine phosphatase